MTAIKRTAQSNLANPAVLQAVPLATVLRHLNSMSSDGVRQLHEKLSILRMVDEANRWRHQGGADHLDQVKRILAGAGVQLT